MTGVLGELLPLAIAVAISPIPIIAAVLMLLSPRAGGTSTGLLLGWLTGIVAATVVFVALAGSIDTASGGSAGIGWAKVAFGVLLLMMAARQFRNRPREGQPAPLPSWMKAIDSFTFAKAAGLGFALSAINPKNLMMCAAAGADIGQADLPGAEIAVAVAVFTVIAGSTIALPVLGYLLARERLAGPLAELKDWLQANNAAVMAVLFLVIGAVLLGKGIVGV